MCDENQLTLEYDIYYLKVSFFHVINCNIVISCYMLWKGSLI